MAEGHGTDGAGAPEEGSPAISRPGVVVLGMHRSGTSAVTGVLQGMGCHLGSGEALMPAQPDNPRGFGERLDVYELNEALLEALGLEWSSTAGIDLDRLGPGRARPLELRAEAIARNLADREPWVLKDPRLCLLMPFWRRFLEEPAVVLVLRHPLAVARSLRARNGLDLEAGLALWEQHVLGSLEHTMDLPRVAVGYEELLSRPETTVRRLSDELSGHGVPGLGTPSAEELKELVDRDLRHHVAKTGEEDDDLPPPVLALWHALADGSLLVPSARPPRLSEASLRVLLDRSEELGDGKRRSDSSRTASLERSTILRRARIERLEDEVERLELELERSRLAGEAAGRSLWRREHESRQAEQLLEDRIAMGEERNRRLEDWLAELDAALTGLLGSRRWQLGSRLAELHQKLRPGGATADPAAHLGSVLAAWRASSGTDDDSEDSR